MNLIGILVVSICANYLLVAPILGVNSSEVSAKNEDLEPKQQQVEGVHKSQEEAKVGGKSLRAGRMLDLDHFSGDIGKEEKMAKERSLSGQRQSRILNEDLIAPSRQEGRTKKLKPKSKLEIKGFIPIVSLEGAKSAKHLEDGNENEEEEDNEEQQQQPYATTRDQIVSNFGGQTSLGHASFGVQPNEGQQQTNSQWAQISPQPLDLQENARANRKLLGGGLLNGLAGSRRYVSTLVQQPQIRPPMNSPLMASSIAQLQQNHHHQQQQQFADQSECICVPFFQCKNGFLSESQLSKSQYQQFAGQQHQYSSQLNLQQTPRELSQTSSSNDLYAPNQQQISSLMTQLNSQAVGKATPIGEQQMVNDIYEQLKKNIENDQLEQQLQLQRQQDQPPYSLQLDERSKLGNRQLESNSSLAEGTQERSLLNPIGRRSSNAQRCGLMRTCCRIPPSLGQPIRAQRLNQPQLNPIRSVQPMSMQTQYQPQATLQQQLNQNQFGQMNPDLNQVAGSALLPTVESQFEQRPNFQGNFMSGRCGTKQTLGIAGRVQNSQPAPGSESSAEFGEFPAHAAILKRLSPGDSLFVCSASLISNQWLATAAHCVKKLRAEELKVRLGEWDVSKDDEFYPFVESNVREILIHPQFQPTSLANDLALIRLEAPLDPQQMPHVAPACLAGPEEQFAGQRCWLAGWGKDAFGQSGAFQSVLRKVDLPVVGRQDCESALRFQTKLGRFFRLHSSNICAGGESGKDACEGDGGAGLYCTDNESGITRVAGLVSWGVGCGQRGVPGVYTSIAQFSRWIEQVVARSGEEGIYPIDLRGLISERSFGVNATTSAPDKVANSTNIESDARLMQTHLDGSRTIGQ